jgi:hypothetical protein
MNCVSTERVTDLDHQIKMTFFEPNLTSFESSIILKGSWGSIENQLEPKSKPPFAIFPCTNL